MPQGFFGAAFDVERPACDGVGRSRALAAGGFIIWHPQIGAFTREGVAR